MVLYHVVTMFHLLNAMLVRENMHKDETSLLMLPDFFTEILKESQIEEMLEFQMFDEIVFFPYTKVKYDENIANQIGEISKELLPCPIGDFSEIYVWGIHFPFVQFLIDENVCFVAAEEATGAFSSRYICKDALKNNPKHLEWASRNGLLDYSNYLIKKVLVNLDAQSVEGLEGDLVDFDVVAEMLSANTEFVDKLLRLFKIDLENYQSIKNHEVLLLTQHFMNLDLMSYVEQKLIYKVLLDFFFPNSNVIIKPHPNDFTDYENIFLNAQIINEKFPVELLPLILDTSSLTIATIYSTGLDTINSHFASSFFLDMEFRALYMRVPLYCSVLQLLLQLDFQYINVVGMNEAISRELENLFKIQFNECENKRECLLLETFDNKNDLFELEDYENIILIDSDDCLAYFLFELSAFQALPISIDVYGEHYEIYWFTKNDYVCDELRGVKMSEKLKHSNDVLNIQIPSDQEIEMAILESKLKATENRLNYYVKLVEDLRRGDKE